MDTSNASINQHFQLIKAETVKIDDAFLQKWRALPGSVTEREFDQKHADYLEAKFKRGDAITMHWAKSVDQNGLEERMNGLHSSTALQAFNGDLPAGLYAHVDTYRVTTDEGKAHLFRQFDDRRSSRDRADVSGAYQMLEPDLRGVNRKVAKRGVEGIGWHDQYVEKVGKLVGDDVYTLFIKEGIHPFLHWQNDLFSVKTPELAVVSVVAAMWRTWNKNQEQAKAFWEITSRGGEPGNESHPTSRLDEWLLAARAKELPKNPAPGEFYNACIYAWNAFRKNENLRSIKHDTTKGLNEAIE